LLVIVPFTSHKGYGWVAANPRLYPVFPAGSGGLTMPSVALIDQVRALDPARVTAIVGALTPAELQPITDGLRGLLAL
jgi:mRNA interferase MazF